MSAMEAKRKLVALLGRPDAPTDALEDYCLWLGRDLTKFQWDLECVRFPWTRGWFAALQWLWLQSREWRGRWVLVQYTAFAWSRRGFPVGLLPVLWILRHHGNRSVVVFHDPAPSSGNRWIDRLRRRIQLRVLRGSYRWSEHSVSTVPLEKVAWLPPSPKKATFVPVGANFSGAFGASDAVGTRRDLPKTVAIFGVTGGARTPPEVEAIAYTILHVAKCMPRLRLLVMGRHADDAEAQLRTALAGSSIDLEIHGILPAEILKRKLREADVLLFVRGGISSRRGSAIAGIVCGLPVIAYSCHETAPPVTDAGVVLVPEGDRDALADALERVLGDDVLRAELSRRSAAARDRYFSWESIACKYQELLDLGETK
jgi:glycosyltransferase involved in cell wall biosynthesis